MSAILPLAHSSASVPDPLFSSPAPRRDSVRARAIRVVIPPVQMAARIASPSDDMALHAEWTPGHGHEGSQGFQTLFTLSPARNAPAPSRVPTRAARRNTLSTAVSGADVRVRPRRATAASTPAVGLITPGPPMENEELPHGEHDGAEDESGHSESEESSRAGSAVDGSDGDAPLFGTA